MPIWGGGGGRDPSCGGDEMRMFHMVFFLEGVSVGGGRRAACFATCCRDVGADVIKMWARMSDLADPRLLLSVHSVRSRCR